jgi:anti-sigma regulatory factor (Ser/Thr protein kinase)
VIERQTFPHATESVPAARHFVLSAVGDISPDVIPRVELMVSEVATNAVVHAASAFEVVVERVDTIIRVEVTDRGTGEPEVQNPSPRDRHGRGLRIVEMFADDWGVRHAPDGAGKTVWFAVGIETPPASA